LPKLDFGCNVLICSPSRAGAFDACAGSGQLIGWKFSKLAALLTCEPPDKELK